MTEIEKLQKQIDDLKKRIEQLESRDGMSPYHPPLRPYEPFPYSKYYTCPVCNMEMNGAMGYVCYHNNCPSKSAWSYGDK